MKLKTEKSKSSKNQTTLKKQNGITLIALIITIVVLLILAGVSISTIFSDNGIIKKAQEAQNKMDQAKENDLREINELNNYLNEIMKNTETGGNTSGGDTPTPTVEWTQNKTKVTNGTTEYTVGDDYTYDCGVSSYTGGWKILGAENGKLLIMSTKDIGTLQLSGKAEYNTGVTQLDNMCKLYGTKARSIKVEDINRVTGYDPNKTGDGKKYGQGQMYEYGNKVTYTSSGSTGSNGQTYNGGLSNNKYEHPDGRAIGTNGVTSITETSNYYYYYPDTLTDNSSGTTVGIAKTTPAYKLLFRNAEDTSNCKYWLASSCVQTNPDYSYFNLRLVNTTGIVGNNTLWRSDGNSGSPSHGVRAVVSL